MSWRPLKNSLIYYLVRCAIGLLQLLPLGVALTLGRAIGRVAGALDGPERRRALSNLTQVLPHLPGSARRKLAREMFVHLGESAVECVLMRRLRGRLGTERSPVRFSPGALEALLGAAAEGRGVLFVTAHLGNWELMAAAVARHAPVSVLSKPSYDPRFTRLVDAFRHASGVQGIDVTRPGHLGQAISVLRRGEVLGVLIDQPPPRGEPISFLGQRAWTSTVVPTLARRTGAAVVVGFARRESPCQHAIFVQRVTLSREAGDVGSVLRAISEPLEKAILGTPGQWTWSLDRWRSAGLRRMSSANGSALCN
jgi:KDO2-lipid IV(A) lauroyltransferase